MDQVLTNSAEETKKIGEKLGRQIKKNNPENLVIALYGDLGSGKTTFIKGLAQGLGIKKIITSPTFALLKEYKGKAINLYHFDFYRIKYKDEALGLGLEEYFQNPKSISVIEWADRIEALLPKETLIIRFDYVNKNKRRLFFEFKIKECKRLIVKIF